MDAPAPASQSASLYVGDLSPEVTEAMLFEEFKQAGPIMSIRVCRDAVTRRSLGYAYVNFQSPSDAERCLETMNYTRIRNRPCRIMWSQRNPALRKTNRGNIFIKSLDAAIDNKALYDTFSAFGNILSCKVMMNDKGESAGYGFVHFQTEEAAQSAIDKVNGMLLNGKQVFVGHFERRNKRTAEYKERFTNIYIKHLLPAVTEEQLRAKFEQFGDIKSLRISKKEDGTSKGFAFINYTDHDAAIKAIETLHDTTSDKNEICLPAKPLYVARHQRRWERMQLREQLRRERQLKLSKYVNLYIKNLDDNVDDGKLRNAFEKFGSIISARVMRDDATKISKGFAFVSFREPDAAEKAIAEMNGKIGGLSVKPIFVGMAQRREDRRLQLEMQFSQRGARGPYGPAGAQGGQQQGEGQQQNQPPFAPLPFGQPDMGGQMGFGGQQQRPMQPRWANMGQQQPFGGPAGQPGAPVMPFFQGGQPPQPPMPAQGARRVDPYGAQGGMQAQQRFLPTQRPAGRPMPQGVMAPQQMQQQAQFQQRPMGPPQGPPMGQPPMGQPPRPPMGMPGMAGPGGMGGMPGMPPKMPAQQMMPVPQPKPAPRPPMDQMMSDMAPLTAAQLRAMPPMQQKNALGERLFAKINDSYPDLAAKITGMLLEMNNDDILTLLHQPALLDSKVHEAIDVLKKHPDEMMA